MPARHSLTLILTWPVVILGIIIHQIPPRLVPPDPSPYLIMNGITLPSAKGVYWGTSFTRTLGYDASRSVDNTTFNINKVTIQTQNLTVTIKAEEDQLPQITIQISVPDNKYVNATIAGASVGTADGAPLGDIYYDSDSHGVFIRIDNPVKGTPLYLHDTHILGLGGSVFGFYALSGCQHKST